MTREAEAAAHMLSGAKPSILMTDAYKFSMAQAGFPLRRESFYLAFRRPGQYFVPFDLEGVIRALLPTSIDDGERAFLKDHGFALTGAMEEDVTDQIEVWSSPKGSWVREREPFLTVTGPSFAVSWLEPLAIWLHWPIQLATAALMDGVDEVRCVTESERDIAQLALDAAGAKCALPIDADAYTKTVREQLAALRGARLDDEVPIFEVGMRGATCLASHRLALSTLADEGLAATSAVYHARELGLKPVGTTGHEHQMRWGDDLAAFRAIRDMRPQRPGYLFDTYDTKKGISAAVQAMRESRERPCAVRYDSGNQIEQLKQFVHAERDLGVRPMHIFMDGVTAAKLGGFEQLCDEANITADRRAYGVGGYLVARPHPSRFTRDRVSAVYKLCETGGEPVMKLSVPSKESLPGRPIIFRSGDGDCMVGQQGELPPPGFSALWPGVEPHGEVEYSPSTEGLIRKLKMHHGVL